MPLETFRFDNVYAQFKIVSLLLSMEAVAFFSPRPHPYLPCFAPLSRRETLSALLSKLKDYGFDQLVS